jgi:hypothetical protein
MISPWSSELIVGPGTDVLGRRFTPDDQLATG